MYCGREKVSLVAKGSSVWTVMLEVERAARKVAARAERRRRKAAESARQRAGNDDRRAPYMGPGVGDPALGGRTTWWLERGELEYLDLALSARQRRLSLAGARVAGTERRPRVTTLLTGIKTS